MGRKKGPKFDGTCPVIKNKDGLLLTMKERNYLKAFTDPKSPTYGKKADSVELAYGVKRESAEKMSSQIEKRPRVQRALHQMLDTEEFNELIQNGCRERLKDPNHKGWQETATFVSKITGAFAPDKTQSIVLEVDKREEEYEKIMKLLPNNEDSI